MEDIKHFRNLEVYRRAFAAAMQIYETAKMFPRKIFARRSNSQVFPIGLYEYGRGMEKTKVYRGFRDKLTDSMQEASETQSWLEFSLACKYINESQFSQLDQEYDEIISMINSMEKNAEKFCF